MSRTTRETVTIVIEYELKSDIDDNLPVPSPPHHDGAQPTRTYIGSDENLALLKESVEKRLREVFPSQKDSHHAELNSLTST